MTDIEYRRVAVKPRLIEPTENRAVDGSDAAPMVVGYAMVWNSDSVDMGFIERIAPTAVDRSLGEIEDGWNVTFQWEHDTRGVPLGSTRGGRLKLRKDDHGLAFELDPARLSFAELDAIRQGDMQMSFGMSVDRHTLENRDDGSVLRVIEELTLYEISAVQSPAYPASEVGTRSDPQWLIEHRAQETPAMEETAPSADEVRRAKKAEYIALRLSR